jgi:hypothetical protein
LLAFSHARSGTIGHIDAIEEEPTGERVIEFLAAGVERAMAPDSKASAAAAKLTAYGGNSGSFVEVTAILHWIERPNRRNHSPYRKVNRPASCHRRKMWRLNAEHSRFHVHFKPTSASWLTLVERWFGVITQQAIRRGSFNAVYKLERAISRFIARWNENAKPFRWTATRRSIRRKLWSAVVTAVGTAGLRPPWREFGRPAA